MLRAPASAASKPQPEASISGRLQCANVHCSGLPAAIKSHKPHHLAKDVVQAACTQDTTRRSFLTTAALVPVLLTTQTQSALPSVAATLTIDQLEVSAC
jgi:hypothetical protein